MFINTKKVLLVTTFEIVLSVRVTTIAEKEGHC